MKGRPIIANCLLFAFWYWLRHPFAARIVWRKSRNGPYPHFMVLTATQLIHFRTLKNGRICAPLLCKGYIKHQPRAAYLAATTTQ